MPKVSEEYRNAKRAEIAEAALRAFRRRGFQATSIADIIAEAGLSAGAIYGHFSGKDEIVLEVATQVSTQRLLDLTELAEAVPMQPPSEMLKVVQRGMLRDLGDPGILVQMWGEAVTDPELRTLATGIAKRLRESYAGYISLWQQREHSLSPEEADALAAEQAPLFVAASQSFILQQGLFGDPDAEGYLDVVTRHLPR